MVVAFDQTELVKPEPGPSATGKELSSFDYVVCGLRFRSNVSFPLATITQTSSVTSDVEFILKSEGLKSAALFPARTVIGNIRNGAGRPSITVSQVEQGQLLECENGTKGAMFFLSRDWRIIECYPEEGMSRQDIECWLFGLVLAYLLQGRNVFSLHGAAIECFGKAVGFLGSNGYGKSTLAYFFLRKGHRLVTDDVLAIIEKEPGFMALPACPSMNLWPKTMSELGCENVDRSPQELSELKARLPLRNAESLFCRSEVPLERLYLLNPVREGAGDRIEISQVSPTLALRELFRHTRAGSVLSVEDQKRLLQFFGTLSTSVPVRRLNFAGGFDKLPVVYEAVVQDVFASRKGDSATRDR